MNHLFSSMTLKAVAFCFYFAVSVFLSPALAGDHVQASFDCKKAKTQIEKAICKSSSVALADQNVDEAYRVIKRFLSTDPKTFEKAKKIHTEWLSNREMCLQFSARGEEETCLIKTYEEHEKALKELKVIPFERVKFYVNPFSCQRFASWQAHWEKVDKSKAEKLYHYLEPEIDTCLKELDQKEENKQYFARNILQLAIDAGRKCQALADKFDSYILSLDKVWSLGTSYLQLREKCLPNDKAFQKRLEEKVKTTTEKMEKFYQDYLATLKNPLRITEVQEDYEKLKANIATLPTLKKLIEVDRAKSAWADSFQVEKNTSKACSKAGEGCAIVLVGQKDQMHTLHVHFEPNNDFNATIKEIELVIDSKIKKLLDFPDDLDVSQINNGWSIDAVDCQSNGEIFLVIGHTTAKFPYYESFRVDPKKLKLVKESDSCKAKEDEY